MFKTIKIWVLRILVWAVAVMACICSATADASADGIFVEGGPGFIQSLSTSVVLLRYQKDTSPLFGQSSFYEGAYLYWNGRNHAQDASLARGLRWTFEKDRYVSTALGAGYLDRETDNLGTRFEFYIRFAVGVRTDQYDFSLGYIHISNGKLFFGWKGPDNGENFVTLSMGGLF